ncbi:MAG TPA: GNAT family N-acetyltransferase [Candidatus Limnocylindria bacterium]|nr:GNAT family N-acetyltransferase [Candidatus Limnocylindria bacterium]
MSTITDRTAGGSGGADVAFRRGTPEDSRACFDVFLEAVVDLSRRIGAPWQAEPEREWTRFEPLYRRIGDHAAEWWVAEDSASGELIGYARSILRGGLFELTEFFVHPHRQAAGVGRRLLELAFSPDRGDVRVIVATPDLRALSRYYRAGTVARFPIVSLTGAPSPADDLSGVEAVVARTDDIPTLVELERAVLEFDRGTEEFAWLLEQREGYIYRRDGRAIGLGFIGRSGTGPILALDSADQRPILLHLEARAHALGRAEVGFEVPMIDEVAVLHLLRRGFRMDQFLTLLLSSRPFGKFDRFIPFSPTFVL